MSRNLCSKTCAFCEGEVRTSEIPRPITKEEAFVYYPEFTGMLVAKAECSRCLAPYLAWVDMRTCEGHPHSERRWQPYAQSGEAFFDLSHYHSFNDEPCDKDMPRYKVRMVPELSPWPRCYTCDMPLWENGECSDYKCAASRRTP